MAEGFYLGFTAVQFAGFPKLQNFAVACGTFMLVKYSEIRAKKTWRSLQVSLVAVFLIDRSVINLTSLAKLLPLFSEIGLLGGSRSDCHSCWRPSLHSWPFHERSLAYS